MRFSPRRLSFAFACATSVALPGLLGACSDDGASSEAELPPAGLAGIQRAASDGEPAYEGLMALPPEEKIVTVGELSFTRADLERSMIHTAARVGLPPGRLEPAVVDALELPAFKQLLKRGLLYSEARKRGVEATDDEVRAERERLVSKLTDGRTLADVLQNMRTDEATFERDLRIDLSVGKLMERVHKELPVVDEKKARELYQKDKERWASDDRVSVSHILVAVPPDAPPTAVNEAHARAEALRQKVLGKDKATFASVAREESDDPTAKQNGGDLGWFSKREMLPGFAEAAFALKQGEVSAVVRSDRGFHVLFGQGRQKRTLPFDEVKARIIATESIAQRTEAEQKLLAQLEETVTIDIHHAPRAAPVGAPPTVMEPPPAAAAAASAGVGAGAVRAPHGAMPPPSAAGSMDHMAIPLPSKDNVLPGAHNPHAGELRLDKSGSPDMQLKLKLPAEGSASPGAP